MHIGVADLVMQRTVNPCLFYDNVCSNHTTDVAGVVQLLES